MRKEGKERGSPLTKTVSQARRLLLPSFPSSLLTLPPPFPPPPPHASKDKIYVKYHFARASLLLGPGDPVLFFPLSIFYFLFAKWKSVFRPRRRRRQFIFHASTDYEKRRRRRKRRRSEMEKTVGGRNVFSRTFLPDSVGEENFPSCCGRGNLDVWSRKKVLLGIEIGKYQ